MIVIEIVFSINHRVLFSSCVFDGRVSSKGWIELRAVVVDALRAPDFEVFPSFAFALRNASLSMC